MVSKRVFHVHKRLHGREPSLAFTVWSISTTSSLGRIQGEIQNFSAQTGDCLGYLENPCHQVLGVGPHLGLALNYSTRGVEETNVPAVSNALLVAQ
jgi:hypothetical protein